ncbi:MAG TPA: tRNA (guanosine(37)-N1)-methyltransferase TrmD [Spirochaetia bacterium]|nr:tRNA (guanosine(37)-N1)-methyltransferase TrmD [Spirochaetia bacterium]
MKFTVLSLFPEIVDGFFQTSLMKKAVERGLIEVELVNIRDFALDKHKSCDDIPYGGGAGMVLKPEPLARALDSVGAGQKRTLYPTPSGRLFDQPTARELAKEDHLVFICGRYEGIDQRIIDEYVDEELSIGDYVLSSGEISSLVIIDAVYRLREGVIKARSLEEESFSEGMLLEYPQYTRPEVFRDRQVPEVLLSGHHKNIEAWRREKSIDKTKRLRPDLLA